MWKREGVNVLAVLLVSLGLLEHWVAAIPQTKDEGNSGRAEGAALRRGPQVTAPVSPQQEQRTGRQFRNPRQRNLIQSIDDMINAPYRGPAVTSMNVFLRRNSLSRPVRQSLRQQFREASSGVSDLDRLTQIDFVSSPRPRRNKQPLEPRRPPVNQERPRTAGTQFQSVNQGESTFSTSLNSDFNPSQPFPVRNNFQVSTSPFRGRLNSNNIRQNKQLSDQTTAFAFQNGVFSNQFQRVKRNTVDENVPETRERNSQYHQSQASLPIEHSLAKTLENMFYSFRSRFPQSLHDLQSFLTIDSSLQRHHTNNNPLTNELELNSLNSNPILSPYLIKIKPETLLIPSPPKRELDQFNEKYISRQSNDNSDYVPTIDIGGTDRKSRTKRSAQRRQSKRRIRGKRGKPVNGLPVVRLNPVLMQRLQPSHLNNFGIEHPRNIAPHHLQHGFGHNLRFSQHHPRLRPGNPMMLGPNHHFRHRNPLLGNNLHGRIPIGKQSKEKKQKKEKKPPMTHIPKGSPPQEHVPLAVSVKQVVRDIDHKPMVETNFADLPSINEQSNLDRVQKIEAMIDQHNEDINRSQLRSFPESEKDLENDFQPVIYPSGRPTLREAPVRPTLREAPVRRTRPAVIKRHPVKNFESDFFKPKLRNEEPNLYEGSTQQPSFKTEIPKFPQFDFMSNFNTPFEEDFFGIQEEASDEHKRRGNDEENDFRFDRPRYTPENRSPRQPQEDNSRFNPRIEDSDRFTPNQLPTSLTHSTRPSSPNHPGVAFIPGPAPIASILPSYNTVRPPLDIVRRNQRRAGHINRRSGSISRNKRAAPHEFESFISQFRIPFDSPQTKQENQGFYDERQQLPAFVSLGGFQPMDEPKEEETEETQFKLNFEIPAFEAPELNMKQNFIGPNDFPAADQKFHDPAKPRSKREAEPVSQPMSFSRVNVNLDAAGTTRREQKQNQPPLVPFDSFPQFNFANFGDRASRETVPRAIGFSSSRRSSEHKRPVATSSSRPQSSSRARSGESQYKPPAVFQAEGQRIYPSINGRYPFARSSRPSSRSASNRRPFYPSPKVASSSKNRGSKNSYNSLPNGFRDFHETFYGQQNRGENKRPASHSHRQQEYAPVDNSLLGSGNFEVLSGGTFYEDESNNNNRHPYDSFLDNGYPYNEKENAYDQPHTNNYVDDFFSNFRDFSEFAVRRSDKPKRDDFFGNGSENINKFVALSPSEAKKINFKSNSKNESQPKSTSVPLIKASASKTTPTLSHPPRNIQEVMLQVEAEPSNQNIATLSVDEKDPLIATF